MSFCFYRQHYNKLKKRNLVVGWKNFAQEQEVWANKALFSVVYGGIGRRMDNKWIIHFINIRM